MPETGVPSSVSSPKSTSRTRSGRSNRGSGATRPSQRRTRWAPCPSPRTTRSRCQFLVAETLFGEMLALPRLAHEAVFYHMVIQDLCKAIPSFPKMMAKVVARMFRQIRSHGV